MEERFYHENPSIAASKLLPPHQHYKPWDLAKPQSYYAAILEITNFVKFKHFKIHTTHSEPAYSTCIIQKIIYLSDWGQPLYKPISLPTQLRQNYPDFGTYTYWDYQQAWFNTFFLQNTNHSHSWLHLQTFPFGSSNGGTILVVILTSSKVTLWSTAVTYFSNNISNPLLLKGSSLPFSFSVQSFLFHGYAHGFMTTTSKTDILFWSANSKSNGGIPLQLKTKVPNLLLRNGYKRTN